MKIHISIESESPVELLEALKKLSADSAVTVVADKREPEAKKPRASRVAEPRQPEPAQVEAAAEATPAAVEADPAAVEEPETVAAPSVVELRAAAQEKGKTMEGKKAIKDLLNSFESKSISDIPEAKRAAFMAALEDL